MTQAYLVEVQNAIVEATQQDGAGTTDAESLLANLAARGLLVVEAPPGLKLDFVGIEG